MRYATCVYTCMHACKYDHIYTYASVFMYIYVYIYIYKCECMYVNICICMNVRFQQILNWREDQQAVLHHKAHPLCYPGTTNISFYLCCANTNLALT